MCAMPVTHGATSLPQMASVSESGARRRIQTLLPGPSAASLATTRRADMETYVFRIRLHDTLDDNAADRLYEGFDEEIAVEEGPRGDFIGFERSAESFLD